MGSEMEKKTRSNDDLNAQSFYPFEHIERFAE